MNLEELQKHWHKFGEEDPLWAILTIPEMKNNQWDLGDFFQRGIDEITGALANIANLNVKLHRGRALDFGCGVGRLTQAMAAEFNEAHGIDIAPSMIEAARQFNKFDDKCQYYVNDRNDLSLFPDDHFDFIYTVIVLQHMHPRYSLPYIQEFLRILRSGGVLIFQLPSDLKVKPQPAIKQQTKFPYLSWLRATYHRIYGRFFSHSTQPFEPRMEMHSIPKDEILAFLSKEQAVILDIQEDGWAGPQWNSYIYYVTKK